MRETVARACLELLVEGKLDLAPATVAERSGVSRKTLYRWWPTRSDLLHNALTFHTRTLEPPDTGAWSSDVEALVEQLAAFLADPIERAQNAILASGLYPEFNRFMFDYYAPIQAVWRGVVERAVARAEVDADLDPDRIVALLISPLLVTTLLERRKPRPKERRELARLVVRATAVGPRPSPRAGSGARARSASATGSAKPRRIDVE